MSCTYLLSRINNTNSTGNREALITVDRRNQVTKPEIQKLYIKAAFKNKGLLKTDLRGAEKYRIKLVRENNNSDFLRMRMASMEPLFDEIKTGPNIVWGLGH